MIEKPSNIDKDIISRLCSAIEKRTGRCMTSPRDFDYLSDLMTKTGTRISASTLKRIWGYNRDISDTYRPYRYTLASLANLLGYKDVDDFQNNHRDDEIQSEEYIGETVMAADIMPGSIVELRWAPGRVCNLVCIEKGCFKVVHSERGRLQPGDIVRFMSLTQNAPLYINEVFRQSVEERFVYTAGQRTGVHFRIRGIIKSDEDTIIT